VCWFLCVGAPVSRCGWLRVEVGEGEQLPESGLLLLELEPQERRRGMRVQRPDHLTIVPEIEE
jgi:hypothetical protein